MIHLQSSFQPRARNMCTSVQEPVPVLWARTAGAAAKRREERVTLVDIVIKN